jgi:hypothetical protein
LDWFLELLPLLRTQLIDALRKLGDACATGALRRLRVLL